MTTPNPLLIEIPTYDQPQLKSLPLREQPAYRITQNAAACSLTELLRGVIHIAPANAGTDLTLFRGFSARKEPIVTIPAHRFLQPGLEVEFTVLTGVHDIEPRGPEQDGQAQ